MRFFFDLIIIFILLFSAYWMYLIIHSFFYKKKNTTLIRLLIFCGLIIIFSTIFYGSFIEPQLITVKHIDVTLNRTTDKENIKITFLTDLHLGPYKQTDFLEQVMRKVETENPDLILFGGDYLYNQESNANYLTPLRNWSEKFKGKMFAVTGNHEFNQGYLNDPGYVDRTATLRQLFGTLGIKILDNEHKKITVNGKSFYITGIPDIWTGTANADQALIDSDIAWQLPTILLSHNPEILLYKSSENFNLILSGHTHGGQIRLPLLGSVPSIPDKLGRAYDKGLFSKINGYIYISAGLGETGTRARLFNPPELTVINLDL